jgi:anti-anti-sigma factor
VAAALVRRRVGRAHLGQRPGAGVVHGEAHPHAIARDDHADLALLRPVLDGVRHQLGDEQRGVVGPLPAELRLEAPHTRPRLPWRVRRALEVQYGLAHSRSRVPSSGRMTPEPCEFELRAERTGVAAQVAVKGELDIATLPEFEQVVRSLRSPDLERLVVDLREVSFLDSMSIELLLRLHTELAKAGAELLVVRGPRAVHRVFELTGLDGVLTVLDQPPARVTPS